MLGQTKINDSINKRIVANDKILESLSEKMDSFNSAIKNQLSFNKMLETQLAQLAAAVPSYEQGKIPGKPEDPAESVKLVSTRYGKPPVRSNWGYLLDPPFITKKDDPGMPTITCEIGPQLIHNVFCDLGSSVNIMSKVIYENLLGGALLPTFMRLQMADQTIQFPEGVAKDILVKIQDEYAPADFVILDMGSNIDVPVILGRPFLNTVNAIIYSSLARSIYNSEVRGSSVLSMAIKLTCSQGTRNRRRNLTANPVGSITKVSRPKRPNKRRNPPRKQNIPRRNGGRRRCLHGPRLRDRLRCPPNEPDRRGPALWT